MFSIVPSAESDGWDRKKKEDHMNSMNWPVWLKDEVAICEPLCEHEVAALG